MGIRLAVGPSFHTYHNWYSLFTGTGDDKAQVVITNDSGTTVGTPFEEKGQLGLLKEDTVDGSTGSTPSRGSQGRVSSE